MLSSGHCEAADKAHAKRGAHVHPMKTKETVCGNRSRNLLIRVRILIVVWRVDLFPTNGFKICGVFLELHTIYTNCALPHANLKV
jgi:hypothetical protein